MLPLPDVLPFFGRIFPACLSRSSEEPTFASGGVGKVRGGACRRHVEAAYDFDADLRGFVRTSVFSSSQLQKLALWTVRTGG